MRHIDLFESFERTISRKKVDRSKFTYSKNHSLCFSKPDGSSFLYYNLYYDNNIVGNVDISNLKVDWDEYMISKNQFLDDSGEKFKHRLKKGEYLLLGISFAKDWRGFNVGLKMLKNIMEENNINRLYLWGSSNHPVWNKVATNTGYHSRYDETVFTLDIDQLNNI